MNESDPFTAITLNYRYGFLAAVLRQLLERPRGSVLSSEELRQLELAKAFLSDVLAGARLVSKRGETKAVSPSRAIGALDYALGSLQAMEELRDFSEERLLALFNDMLLSIDESIRAGRIAGNEDALRLARGFFGHLNETILAALSRQHRESRSRMKDCLSHYQGGAVMSGRSLFAVRCAGCGRAITQWRQKTNDCRSCERGPFHKGCLATHVCEVKPVPKTLKVEVVADGTGKWCGNALRFGTVEEARAYGDDLYARWTAVRDLRVVDEATGEVHYRRSGGRRPWGPG